MTRLDNFEVEAALSRAFEHAGQFRNQPRSLDATQSVAQLRESFCLPTPERVRQGDAVIADLIEAAQPGLVGNTEPNFFGWVMGGSDTTGVAADCLTSIWGQNAGIFQTSPAAAIAEEAVADWLLDFLDLPRSSSVGLVTGATMAGFVCLAAARGEVLARVGYDLEANGLQGAPEVRIYLGDDTHTSNLAALRYLGFGERNLVRVACNEQGLMRTGDLKSLLAKFDGPKIIIGTAGHINSGGFEDFERLARLARQHGAWLHVDGAFGLWARLLPEKSALTRGIEMADSWSVDGHKWLQIPYDSGFAIVRDANAHQRAMDITANYLNHAEEDGRNPTHFNPELSRRARGFAAWAVMQTRGRAGIRNMIRRHCAATETLSERLSNVVGIDQLNRVDLNQLVLTFSWGDRNATEEVADLLNCNGRMFVRTTIWKGVPAMRISIISKDSDRRTGEKLAEHIAMVWKYYMEWKLLPKNFEPNRSTVCLNSCPVD